MDREKVKKVFKKIGDVLWILFLVACAIFYALVAYEIMDYFDIGVDGS